MCNDIDVDLSKRSLPITTYSVCNVMQLTKKKEVPHSMINQEVHTWHKVKRWDLFIQFQVVTLTCKLRRKVVNLTLSPSWEGDTVRVAHQLSVIITQKT